MQLLAGRVDVLLAPIGDNYTMGIADAVRAVVPMHYNTWEENRVVILAPGESHTFT